MKQEQIRKTIFNKDFTLVVIGQIISLFGNSILRFALPLYLLRQTGFASKELWWLSILAQQHWW